MRNLKRYNAAFKEWLIFTLTFFFLYDVIWAIADFDNFKKSIDGYYICLFIDFIYCGIFSFVSLAINQILLKRKFFKLAETNKNRFLSCATIIVIVNIIIATICDLLLDLVIPAVMADDIWGTFFLFAIIASLLTLIHLLMHYSNVVIRKNNENIRLQKRYLRLQLDPHFVFNSLSSLAGMIAIEPQKAEEYVIRLSHVYRYMLQHIEQDYITIKDAMDFAERYVSLLNLRYNDNILLDMDRDTERDGNCILALSLQLLIENAVKHNTPKEDAKLHIQINKNNGMLRIKNNRIYTKMRNDQTFESYGIGLKNLEQRYKLESGKEIEYFIKPDSFEICLPIIKKVYKS